MAEDRRYGEIITGSDFKRMAMGAYSEFLLEYEHINELNLARRPQSGARTGTNILRTIAAAVKPLLDTQDDSIGSLARRVASCAVLGARGNSGVVLAQIFRGLAKGLWGKREATSSEFGKAFQYGILYAQRMLPEEAERPIVEEARAVARGAHDAVRQGGSISEILTAAIEAGEAALPEDVPHDVGEEIMLVFLHGCLKGLDGNFVSPGLSFSLASASKIPGPKDELVHPYCLTYALENPKARLREIEALLQEDCSFVMVEREDELIHIHVHTDKPGTVMERSIGWGPLKDIGLNNMAEPHTERLSHAAMMPVALLAVAEDTERAEFLQELGATLITFCPKTESAAVGTIVNAAHSDFADAYVIVSHDSGINLVLRQVKRILGERVEIVEARSHAEQEKAVTAFDSGLSVKENAARLCAAMSEE